MPSPNTLESSVYSSSSVASTTSPHAANCGSGNFRKASKLCSMRQNTTETLSYFLRVAGTANFPGAVINSTTLVAPNTWTEVVFDIDPDSPLCFGEGVTCAQALANVAHLQFGASAPAALTALNQTFTLDLDEISIASVPEPTALLLLASGLAGLAWQGRRRET